MSWDIEVFRGIVAGTLLVQLDRGVIDFVLLGYLAEIQESGPHVTYYLFGKMHSPCHVACGEIVTTPLLHSGDRLWYRHGQRHRDGDLPAEIMCDGSTTWYRDGHVHRDGDLPARIDADGGMVWYRHSLIHRDGDLPAAVYKIGLKCWYQNGQKHREGDLPAVVYPNGIKYYRRDVEYTP